MSFFGRSVDGDPSLRYVLNGRRPGLFTVAGPDKPPTRFLSWAPKVTRHLVRLDDDGRCVERRYEIQVDGVDATITSDDLTTGRVWRELIPGAKGTGRSKVRDALENVVMEQAVDLPSTWMLKRTGWFDLPDGRWVYVRANDDVVDGVRTVDLKPELVKASLPLPKAATLPAQKKVVKELATHGWGPAFGLAVGVRALAWSVVPVRGSLIPHGRNNTGKTLTFWVASCLTLTNGWPPYVDSSFSDTITAIEMKIRSVQDRVIAIEDMPLTSNSEAAAVKDAVEKSDRMTRAQFNNTPVRDRSERKSDRIAESPYVRGILILTAQQIPTAVQASMLRRVVCAEFHKGDNDWRWYTDNGAGMEAPIRTIGDRVIKHMAALGKEKAEAWVKDCDQRAKDAFLPVARAAVGADAPDGMDGVLKAAYQMMAGLLMVKDACGLDVQPLWHAIIPKFTASLKAQADMIGDRQTADTGIPEALGSVLRRSLQERRAHIRCPKEAAPKSLVPGQTPQAQGLREDTFDGTSKAIGGEGSSLYYMEDGELLGITASDLHTLVMQTKDIRLTGFQVKSLPGFLLKEGAILRSTQAGQVATTKVRIGANKKAMPLVLIPASTVFTLPEADDDTPDDDDDQDQPENGGPSEGPEEEHLQEELPSQLTASQDNNSTPVDQGIQAVDHTASQPSQAEPHRLTVVPAQATGPVAVAPASATGGVVLAVTGGQLVNAADATSVTLEEDAATSLAALVDQAVRMVPNGRLTLLIGTDAHRGFKLGPEAPSMLEKDPWAPAFQTLADAGWHKPMSKEKERMYVGQSALMQHPARADWVRITPVQWLSPDSFPKARTRAMRKANELDTSDVLTLAYRLVRFAQVTGHDFEGKAAGTGIAMLRARIEETARQHPKWQGSVADWPQALDDSGWSRTESDAETAQPWRNLYDANKAYLPAYRQATVARDDLAKVDHPMFDRTMAGFWDMVVPEWPHPLVPAPVPNHRAGQVVTVTTDIVQAYVDLGITPEIQSAYIAQAVSFDGFRAFSDSIRDQLLGLGASADTDDQAVALVLKEVYHTVHGKLRNADQGVIRRPDWGHAVRDAAWTNTLRKVYRAAGITKAVAEPRFPVRVKTDEITYASDHQDPEADVPFGLRIDNTGAKLGYFKAKAQPQKEYEAEQKAAKEKATLQKERMEARKADRAARAARRGGNR
ncbi:MULTISPECIES: hypothetical protein [Streptomyces]|uniref:hypothetical protein n=1 Tax=Streptomyces TaxID=1883 RepID=UPI00226EDB00|nr:MULTISPECIES: hypothetical protein [unclassified Streptomyces]MCY0923704.1 hypothetical protein [Streptomyces sp. H27-G5]MCY0947741.1 hypothetical protein [Streptomyces sp. H34-AA3]MDJ0466986.1 hypothetical protein [Streptomyces sp. H27-C3]